MIQIGKELENMYTPLDAAQKDIDLFKTLNFKWDDSPIDGNISERESDLEKYKKIYCPDFTDEQWGIWYRLCTDSDWDKDWGIYSYYDLFWDTYSIRLFLEYSPIWMKSNKNIPIIAKDWEEFKTNLIILAKDYPGIEDIKLNSAFDDEDEITNN